MAALELAEIFLHGPNQIFEAYLSKGVLTLIFLIKALLGLLDTPRADVVELSNLVSLKLS